MPRLLYLIAVFILMLTACQQRTTDLPTATILGVSTPTNTLTATSKPPPSATATALPSKTPVLTATPTTTPTVTSMPTAVPRTTLLFTGVIVPARCVQAAIDARGDNDYPYDEVREVISAADLAVGTLNATISDYPPHTGCVPTYVLVGDSGNADALARAGFDVMSVATNHIKNCGLGNCGDRAFLDTLENLKRVGISPVGAGLNHVEAMQPVVVELNGVRYGFVSLGHIEPMVFAGDDSPGIAVLDEKNLRVAIAAAREVSDVVIAMPHWGPEDSTAPGWWQLALAEVAVDAGADLVVGNHTHVVQAYEEIDGVMVFYGLGNFVFDQEWPPENQQGVILSVDFEGSSIVSYEFIPTHVDTDGTVHLAEAAEAAEILDRIEAASRLLPSR
jgi:poly-gamma-glutamate capsule biosynthesis protein CapA/YwtB (metallophosphatase superfamily)